METNNTLKARHLRKTKSGKMYIGKKEYTWHIPKVLREENINLGDIVRVSSHGQSPPVLVTSVFRENFEDTGIRYKSVRKKVWSRPNA